MINRVVADCERALGEAHPDTMGPGTTLPPPTSGRAIQREAGSHARKAALDRWPDRHGAFPDTPAEELVPPSIPSFAVSTVIRETPDPSTDSRTSSTVPACMYDYYPNVRLPARPAFRTWT